ncbi:hypothetical protein BDF19DRAFT_410707 [Syncephalis fuscata]|nr:hypothetical protein BDF19DRAFT_410707 [Syncephalis fuscata]
MFALPKLVMVVSQRWPYLLSTLLCLNLAILLSPTSAIPVFNSINSVDTSGNVCPRMPARNQACPLLCVRDPLRDCPELVRPACPKGKRFCGDGTCQSSCRGIVNACTCGGSATSSGGLSNEYYLPCMANQLTNIPLLDREKRKEQIISSCASDLQLDLGNIGNATGDPLADNAPQHAWLQCPLRDPPKFSFTEATFIAIYVYLGVLVALLSCWQLYKRFYESKTMAHEISNVLPSKYNTNLSNDTKTRSRTSSSVQEKAHRPSDISFESSALTSNEGSVVSNDDSDCKFHGYYTSFIGLLAYSVLHLTTLIFFVILAVIVADYYGAVTGVDFGVLLTSDISSVTFIAIWHVLAVWLVTLNFLHPRLRNYFRLRTILSRAQFVQVAKTQPTMIMLTDDHETRDLSFIDRVMKFVSKLEQWFVKLVGANVIIQSVPVQVTTNGRRYFEFQCTRYVQDSVTGKFAPYTHNLGRTYGELRSHASGLAANAATQLRDLLGPNFIRVDVPSFIAALFQEFRAFFYIYQVMCLWVWYYFAYANMAAVQTVVIFVSALVKVVIRLHSERKVKRLAEHRDVCRVFREGEWRTNLSTTELVPGDVIEIVSNTKKSMPCDAVILSGEVIVDESSLTGESMPIRKFAMRPEESNVAFQPHGSSKSVMLFSGTTVLQTTKSSSAEKDNFSGVTALVVATNTATDKGKLVRKILFPAPVSFVFNEHLRVVICILLLWGFICFCLTMWLMGRGDAGSWFYGIFAISYVMSPLLPATLVVGQSVAAARLRRKQIFCIDLPRVMIAGKVRVFCFDKTGTLTKEGLDYYGVQSVATSTSFGNESSVFTNDCQPSVEHLPRLVQIALASCHAVSAVDGRLIGNPVDIEQFRATGWQLQKEAQPGFLDTLIPSITSAASVGIPVHVVKRFEFVHARASMSVVVQDPSDGHLHIFMKGSFERVKDACNANSLPLDYDEKAAKYAAEGCYVLALGHCDLGPIAPDAVTEMTRDDLERNCNFIGLLLFKNQLKHDTTTAITELKEGDTRTVMITGDNALTGVYIARQCGMLPHGVRVLLADEPKKDLKSNLELSSNPSSRLYWKDIVTGEFIDDVEAALADQAAPPTELAVTGKAFAILQQTGQIRRLLLHTRVFARMTPEDKVQCVQLHMERAITAMCGDGGNDCGALRVAHCGIALSNAEASIVSPFSTGNPSIDSCVELLRQGRAALATSFTGYKFLVTYGEVMAFRGIMQSYFSVVMSQWIYVLIDSIITVGLSFALTQAQPARRLAALRPTARLFGAQTLSSVVGQVAINIAFLFGAFGLLYRQSWFRCHEFDSRSVDNRKWWLLGDNYEAQNIACITLFQFLAAAFAYNFGHRFRRTWWRNWVFVVFWTAVYCFYRPLSLLIQIVSAVYSV